jgi:hypothetical protein
VVVGFRAGDEVPKARGVDTRRVREDEIDDRDRGGISGDMRQGGRWAEDFMQTGEGKSGDDMGGRENVASIRSYLDMVREHSLKKLGIMNALQTTCRCSLADSQYRRQNKGERSTSSRDTSATTW